jgi:hypothetical protein
MLPETYVGNHRVRETQATGFAILLVPGGFPSQSMEAQPSPLSLTARALAPQSKSKNARFRTEDRKAITCYSARGTRSTIPPRYTEAQHFVLHLLTRESNLSCPTAGIPATPLSGNPLLFWC